MDEIKRLHELTQKLKRYSEQYYVNDEPEISDYEYDMLQRELIALEEKHPEEREPDSPTIRIGGRAVTAFETGVHEVPMESLQDAFDDGEITAFDTRVCASAEKSVEYVVELKIDGLSVALEYENGIFKRGLTRGDGHIGEDVTENLRTVRTIPMKLNAPVNVTVRGEVYMPRKVWEKLNDERKAAGKPLFANPRNAAAGSLRQLDSKITASRHLAIIVFNLQKSEKEFALHSETLDWLKSLGFTVSPEYRRVYGSSEMLSEISRLGSMRDSLPFDIDGAVVKVNDITLRKRLGSTAKTPRWAIAFKYPPEIKQTVIKSIEVNVGRTGVLTPLAIFEPVFIAGSLVTRATLHNRDWIAAKDIRVGDTVGVRKAGDVIPEIVSSDKTKRSPDSLPFEMPKICPSCGEPVFFDECEAAVRCENSACPAQTVRNVIHFASKDAMDIDGLGEALSERLCSLGLVKSCADIYTLKSTDLSELDGLGDKSADNIIAAIAKSKENCLSRLIYALGIPEVGAKTAKLLAARFNTLDAFSNALTDELLAVNDIGPATAESVIRFFSLHDNRTLLSRLFEAGLNTHYLGVAAGAKLEGMTFVITGTLPTLGRAEASELIESQGGKVSGSVSKKTTFLLAGEDAGSKLQKAKELGLKIIDENSLREMIG